METRRLGSADLDEYFALRLEMLRESPDAFLVTYEEEKAKGPGFFAAVLADPGPDNAIFGAYLDGKLVGAAGVFRESERIKLRHKAVLWGMYVKPEARGRGTGKALVRAVMDHARGPMRCTALFLTVEGNNEKARALYERQGFRIWGTQPMAYRIGEEYRPDHNMWVDLGSP